MHDQHKPDTEPGVMNAGTDMIHRGVDAAKDGVNAAGNLASRTKQRVKEGAHAVDGAVHAHPYATLAIGAGVGLLVGMLLRRCRCPR
jgi:ElaB/YqjD/DUF883 family membrane-anchored ribosome-binding protein